MSLHMIAVHKLNKEVIGYRIYDTDTRVYKDVKMESVYENLFNGLEVMNITIEDSEVAVIGNRQPFYTTTEKGKIISNIAYVVIKKIEKENRTDYVVVNYWGKEETMTDMMIEMYNSKVAIANIDIHDEAYDEIIEVEKEKGRSEISEEIGNRLKMLSNRVIEVDEQGRAYINDKSELKYADGEVVIPKGVKEIRKCGFKGTGVVRVVIPETVSVIGEEAFSECIDLKEVVLNNGLQEIKNMAFKNCKKLVTINIPSTVKSIGVYAFKNAGLREAKINSRNTKMEMTSFERKVRKVY